MNGGATVFVVLGAISAAADWWSVATGRRSIERIAKPLTLVLLIVVALLVDPSSPTIRAWFVVALVLSLIGDVFLMLDRDLFVAGLAAFLAAHVAYIVGLALADLDVAAAFGAVLAALLAVGVIGRRIQRSAAASDPRLTAPVAAYIGVISAMLVAAAATTNLVAIGGAVLFYSSDAILGWNRFVAEIEHGPLLTMMTYHGAQALLVVALLSL